MTWLDFICLVSFILAAGALAAMVALIIHRWLRNRRAVRESARLAVLSGLALEYLETPGRAFVLKAQLAPADRPLLLRLFRDLLPKVRGEYAERVVHLMHELGVVEECLRTLKERAWWRRAEACALLGSFNEHRVILALEAAFDDPHLEVRIKAARSLIDLGAVRSVGNLLTKLAPVTATPSLAVTDLFRSFGKEAVPELILLLEQDAHETVKLLAADALGHIGDLDAVPPLLKLYSHASVPLRVTILHALSSLADPRSLEVVLRALEDSAWDVRAKAAWCAGQLGSHAAIALLAERLNDEQWWARFYAAEALFKLGGGIAALRAAAGGTRARAADIANGLLREKGLAA